MLVEQVAFTGSFVNSISIIFHIAKGTIPFVSLSFDPAFRNPR